MSCSEVWEIKIDGDNSEVAHTLCVAANATITGGELSFAAAVAPVRSEVVMYDTYPLDKLSLELIVDGVSYHSDSLVHNKLFWKESGFVLKSIHVETNTPVVEMIITDKFGNYNTVRALGTAIKAPEMDVEVSVTKVKRRLNPYVPPWWRSKDDVFPPKDPWEIPHAYNGCDSIYAASLFFYDPLGMKNYYMVSVEFECFDGLFLANPDLIGTFGTYDPACWKKMGYVPFTSEDNIFHDDMVASSIGGYDAYFCNVFDDSTFDGKGKSFTISFENMFPQICKTDLRGDFWPIEHRFFSNAETPFHIYLFSLKEKDYFNYKRIMHRLSSGGSIFDMVQTFTSNIEGGFGYFTIINSNDFFYYDDNVYVTTNLDAALN